MKNRNRFIIGLIAAAVTFSTLWVALGPKRFASHRYQHCGEEVNRFEQQQQSNEKVQNPIQD